MTDTKTLLALNGEIRGSRKDYSFIEDFLSQTADGNNIPGQEVPDIIAADGGALFLEKLSMLPDIIIGDLDSLSEKKCDYFRQHDVKIMQFPTEKDKTDGELVMDFCQQNQINFVLIVGAAGGRLDQQLGNISLLEYALKLGIKAVIREPEMEIGLIDKGKKFIDNSGDLLSLIPLTEKVTGINLSGCKYTLEDEALFRYRNRGISNTIVQKEAAVEIREGLLLYMKGCSF